MNSEMLSPAAQRLLGKSAPITLDEALAVCPWRSVLGQERNTEEMMGRLGAVVVVINQKREPLSADMLADVAATMAHGQTVLLIAARREDRDFAEAQILAMAGGGGHA